jgi:predicted nucleotidyltransferase
MKRMASFREGSTVSIEQVAATLAHHPDIQLAIVFGSVAHGNAGRDSDVDVAVQLARPMNADEKMQLIAELATATGRPVDLIDLRTVGEPLLGQILKHGRMIRGDATDLATLMQQHVYAMEDFMPYVDRMLEERRRAWIG